MPTEDAEETLAQRVRRVQKDTGSVDPRELADKVIAELEDSSKDAALAEAMPEFVRVVIRTGRNGTMRDVPPPGAKVQAVRSWYERLLAQPVDVSGEAGRWKALRDCTRDELLAVAHHRREAAARNLHTAEMYERLAGFMKPGQTVGALNADLVTGLFRRADA